MGLLKDARDLIDHDVTDFEGAWDLYREMTKSGIIEYGDAEIRMLHGRMSFLLSHAEMNLGSVNSRYVAARVASKLKKSQLLIVKYPEGAFNQRTAQVEADDIWQKLAQVEAEAEADVEIWKGQVHATQTAVELLSREISARLKK